MGDTFERVQETAPERGLLQRGLLLIEMQEGMRKHELEDERNFPAWLHVVRLGLGVALGWS